MSLRVDFLNPVHHLGRNSTVRKGPRWIEPGTQLDLCKTGAKEVAAVGTVVAVHVMFFEYITDSMLENEHDPSCRDIAGLQVALARAYGYEFGPNEVATIVEYEVYV